MTVEQIIVLASEGFDATTDAIIALAQRTLAEHGAAGYKGINKAIKKLKRDLNDCKDNQDLSANKAKFTEVQARIEAMYPGAGRLRNRPGALMLIFMRVAVYYHVVYLLAQGVKTGTVRPDVLVDNITALKAYNLVLDRSAAELFPDAEYLVKPLMEKVDAILSLIQSPVATGDSGYPDFSAN